MVTLSEAYAKLATLSEDRARCVFELIENLAELEALEDAQDVADALKAKAESGNKGTTLQEWKKELGL